MGKSLGNTISPGEMVDKFGADTVRLFILFGANPEAGMDWSDSALEANNRQLNQIVEAFRNTSSIESNKVGWMIGYWDVYLKVEQDGLKRWTMSAYEKVL